jgi:hypothetical protein
MAFQEFGRQPVEEPWLLDVAGVPGARSTCSSLLGTGACSASAIRARDPAAAQDQHGTLDVAELFGIAPARGAQLDHDRVEIGRPIPFHDQVGGVLGQQGRFIGFGWTKTSGGPFRPMRS